MSAYYVSVMEVHPDGDDTKNSSKYVFGPKQCLTVQEANELFKMKREEYTSSSKGKIQYQVSKELY